MKSKDIVKEWTGAFGTLEVSGERSAFHPDEAHAPRYVGVPSQSAICRFQLDGIDVRSSTTVKELLWSEGQWHLFAQPGAPGSAQKEPLGSFDALVLADRLCADPASRLSCAGATHEVRSSPRAAVTPRSPRRVAPPKVTSCCVCVF
jgi:predicted NAD/FAD-dependent oxidoreductase